MKAKVISTIVIALSMGGLSTMATAREGHSTMSMDMAKDPHHVLAMAYHHNLAIFAKAVREQTARASSVNVEFARPAVAEMRRSFDQMKQQHQECSKAMSAEMQAKMKGMMQKMERHQDQLNEQLTALEKEVASAAPDPKKVSTLASSVLAHLDGMSKSQGMKMKMKMKM